MLRIGIFHRNLGAIRIVDLECCTGIRNCQTGFRIGLLDLNITGERSIINNKLLILPVGMDIDIKRLHKVITFGAFDLFHCVNTVRKPISLGIAPLIRDEVGTLSFLGILIGTCGLKINLEFRTDFLSFNLSITVVSMLEQIEAEYYVLLNSDVEVSHHWLTPLIEFMDNNADVAACQPKLLSMKNRDAFEYAGACGGYLDRYGYPFCRGRVFDTVEYDGGQYDYEAEILWATGACMVVRAADFKQTGGFDARFFAHSEEIDLCWRLRLSGKKIYCIPDSFVYHIGGGTLPKNNPMKTYLNFRNNLTMLYKNLPDKELRHVMRVRLFLDYLAAFQALLSGHFGDCKAIVKARKAFKKWLPEYREVRAEVQACRTVDDAKGIYRRSILWQYYAKGHKKYSELDA